MGGTISDTYIGVLFAAGIGDGAASHVSIDGTHFDHITQKGIYAETFDQSTITGIVMNNVGQYGGGLAFGTQGKHGAGIDLNLKYADYSGIVIDGFTFTDVGLSNGLGSPHAVRGGDCG